MDDTRLERFALVNAGHQFLLDALPLRSPDSGRALDAFVRAAGQSHLRTAELDAVLIRCLRVIDLHAGGTLPTLVDRYVMAPLATAPLEHFRECIEDSICYAGITDGNVQDVIHLIRMRFAEPGFTPHAISDVLGIRSSTLCGTFKRSTNRTMSEYIRDVRLERAAQLLATTNLTVKEVWSRVGYNYGSNFGHDFKKHFGCAPGEYRARIVRPAAQAHLERSGGPSAVGKTPTEAQAVVLLVDDSEATRLVVATHLHQRGYRVASASTGLEGLRMAEQICPDVVLLDYHLGDMNGLEFVRRLHGSIRCRNASVTIVTADCDVVDIAKHFHYSRVTVTSKLCDLSTIDRIVDNQCAGVDRLHKRMPGVKPTDLTPRRGSSSAA